MMGWKNFFENEQIENENIWLPVTHYHIVKWNEMTRQKTIDMETELRMEGVNTFVWCWVMQNCRNNKRILEMFANGN